MATEFTDEEKDKIEQEIKDKMELEAATKKFHIACDNGDAPTIIEILDNIPEIKIKRDLLAGICEKGQLLTYMTILSRRYNEVKDNIQENHMISALLRGHLKLFVKLLEFNDPDDPKTKLNHHFLYHISRTKQECKVYENPLTDTKLSDNERYLKKQQDNDSNSNKVENHKILCEKEMVNITNYVPHMTNDEGDIGHYYLYRVRIFRDSRVITNSDKRIWVSSKYELYDEEVIKIGTKEEWVTTVSKYYRRYFLGDKSDGLQKKWIQFEKDPGYQTEQLKTDGLMIEWIENPTIEQCKVAVAQTGYAVCMIPEDKKDQLEEFIGTQPNRTKYHYRNGMDFSRHKELFHCRFL